MRNAFITSSQTLPKIYSSTHSEKGMYYAKNIISNVKRHHTEQEKIFENYISDVFLSKKYKKLS